MDYNKQFRLSIIISFENSSMHPSPLIVYFLFFIFLLFVSVWTSFRAHWLISLDNPSDLWKIQHGCQENPFILLIQHLKNSTHVWKLMHWWFSIVILIKCVNYINLCMTVYELIGNNYKSHTIFFKFRWECKCVQFKLILVWFDV